MFLLLTADFDGKPNSGLHRDIVRRLLGHKRPAERVDVMFQMQVAPEEKTVDEPVDRAGGDGLRLLDGLPDERVGTAPVE